MKLYKLLLALFCIVQINLYSTDMDLSEDQASSEYDENEGDEAIDQENPFDDLYDTMITDIENNNVEAVNASLNVLKNSISSDELYNFINQTDNLGYLPLTLSIICGHLDCTQVLIQYGADLDKSDNAECLTALMFAIMHENDQFSKACTELILNAKKQQLSDDVSNKRKSEQEANLAYKQFLNDVDVNNFSVLYKAYELASETNDYDQGFKKCLVELLIKEGASFDVETLYELIKNNDYAKVITLEVFINLDLERRSELIQNLDVCLKKYLSESNFSDQAKKQAEEVRMYFNSSVMQSFSGAKNIFEVLKKRESRTR